MKRFEREDGFTLVEILVVVGIIGILASISVPVYTNQRKVSNDAAVESDVTSAARAVETHFVNNPSATNFTVNDVKALMPSKSEGVTLSFRGVRDDYCIWGTHTNGKVYTGWKSDTPAGVRPYFLYRAIEGGAVDKNILASVNSCYGTAIGSW